MSLLLSSRWPTFHYPSPSSRHKIRQLSRVRSGDFWPLRWSYEHAPLCYCTEAYRPSQIRPFRRGATRSSQRRAHFTRDAPHGHIAGRWGPFAEGRDGTRCDRS